MKNADKRPLMQAIGSVAYYSRADVIDPQKAEKLSRARRVYALAKLDEAFAEAVEYGLTQAEIIQAAEAGAR